MPHILFTTSCLAIWSDPMTAASSGDKAHFLEYAVSLLVPLGLASFLALFGSFLTVRDFLTARLRLLNSSS
uniref:Uncharacterized protein n=1 Tax=Ixodes ricinus TaxID=34613 RepID=A0A6B0U1V7_IXORI